MFFNQFDTHSPSQAVIETYSGKTVDLLKPQTSDIVIDDIAHHLSRIARFTGATHGEFANSVANHSFWVADHLYLQTDNALLALHGLLHDAHEAYIGDISSPMKAIPEVRRVIRRLSNNLQHTIMQALALPSLDAVQREEVKKADLLSLAIEARKFMHSGGTTWHTAKLEVDHLVDSYQLHSPERDKANFISAYLFLNNKIKRH